MFMYEILHSPSLSQRESSMIGCADEIEAQAKEAVSIR